MYPTSVSNFPGPEHGVSFIAIVDLVSSITLVGFSLLRPSYDYNIKGPVIYV